MCRRLLLSAQLVAFLGVALAGCTKPVVREKQVPDPLLVSKKPVEGKPHLGVSRAPAVDDIPPPPPRPADNPPPPSAVRLQPPLPSAQ